MQNEEIYFSVIIPTRNRPIEFQAALDSVLSQSYTQFEVIVINDGTNENFRKEYDELEHKYTPKNVRFFNLIVRTRGHGHCFARNQGVDAAKGNFICFLDDDDYWTDPDFLARAAQHISDQQADFYIANQQAVTANGDKINNVWVENLPETLAKADPRQTQKVFPVTVRELFKASGFPHQNCCAISTALYNQVGGMDENLRYEPDRDIYLRVIDKAQTIVYDRAVISVHNVPDNTKSNNASTKTNKLEKLLFQLRTVEKSILFAVTPEVVQFCRIRKGYILKQIAEELFHNKKQTLAYWYAKEALSVAFTFKWLLYTVYCGLKKIFSKD
ncbi:MAG: glycosyltransferase family 2 protein [Thalassotalea sp.]